MLQQFAEVLNRILPVAEVKQTPNIPISSLRATLIKLISWMYDIHILWLSSSYNFSHCITILLEAIFLY